MELASQATEHRKVRPRKIPVKLSQMSGDKLSLLRHVRVAETKADVLGANRGADAEKRRKLNVYFTDQTTTIDRLNKSQQALYRNLLRLKKARDESMHSFWTRETRSVDDMVDRARVHDEKAKLARILKQKNRILNGKVKIPAAQAYFDAPLALQKQNKKVALPAPVSDAPPLADVPPTELYRQSSKVLVASMRNMQPRTLTLTSVKQDEEPVSQIPPKVVHAKKDKTCAAIEGVADANTRGSFIATGLYEPATKDSTALVSFADFDVQRGIQRNFGLYLLLQRCDQLTSQPRGSKVIGQNYSAFERDVNGDFKERFIPKRLEFTVPSRREAVKRRAEIEQQYERLRQCGVEVDEFCARLGDAAVKATAARSLKLKEAKAKAKVKPCVDNTVGTHPIINAMSDLRPPTGTDPNSTDGLGYCRYLRRYTIKPDQIDVPESDNLFD